MKITNILPLIIIFSFVQAFAMPGLPSLDDIGDAIDASDIPDLEDYKDLMAQTGEKIEAKAGEVVQEIPTIDEKKIIDDISLTAPEEDIFVPDMPEIEAPDLKVQQAAQEVEENIGLEVSSEALNEDALEIPTFEPPITNQVENEVATQEPAEDFPPMLEIPSFEDEPKNDVVQVEEETDEDEVKAPEQKKNDIVIYNRMEDESKDIEIRDESVERQKAVDIQNEEFPEVPNLNFPSFSGNEREKRVVEINPEKKEEKADKVLNTLFAPSLDDDEDNEDDIIETDDKIVEVDDTPVVRPISSLKSNIKSITLDSGSSDIASGMKSKTSSTKHIPVTYQESQLIDLMVFSAMIGDVKSVASLVHSGRDINSKNKYGQTALMASVFNSNHEITELLLSEGAKPNVRDIDKNTALHIASSRSNPFAVQQLIKYGADVDLQNIHGDTPLLLATNKNAFNIIKMLIKGGADVDKPNKKGATPLKVSQYFGNQQLEQLLISVGAKDGYNPFAKRANISDVITARAPQASEVSKAISESQLAMFPKSLVAKEIINNNQKEPIWWAETDEPQTQTSQSNAQVRNIIDYSKDEMPSISTITDNGSPSNFGNRPKSFVYKELVENAPRNNISDNEAKISVRKLDDAHSALVNITAKSDPMVSPLKPKKPSSLKYSNGFSNVSPKVQQAPEYVNNVKKNIAPIVTRFDKKNTAIETAVSSPEPITKTKPLSYNFRKAPDVEKKVPEIRVAPMRKISSQVESQDLWGSRLAKWVRAGLMVEQMNPTQKQTWQGQQKTLQEHYGASFDSEVDKVIKQISNN